MAHQWRKVCRFWQRSHLFHFSPAVLSDSYSCYCLPTVVQNSYAILECFAYINNVNIHQTFKAWMHSGCLYRMTDHNLGGFESRKYCSHIFFYLTPSMPLRRINIRNTCRTKSVEEQDFNNFTDTEALLRICWTASERSVAKWSIGPPSANA